MSAAEVNATLCGQMTGFVNAQRRICKAKPLLVPSIRKGVLLAMKECKRQLSKERWDCSTMTEATALKGLLAIRKFNYKFRFRHFVFFMLSPIYLLPSLHDGHTLKTERTCPVRMIYACMRLDRNNQIYR